MAQTIVLTSDLSGATGNVTTVTYSFDGRDYEIDLTAAEQKELAAALKPYLTASRLLIPRRGPGRPPKNAVTRTTGRPAARKVTTNTPTKSTRGKKRVDVRPAHSVIAPAPATVRAWAASQNIDVPSRGRIPEDVMVKFQTANV